MEVHVHVKPMRRVKTKTQDVGKETKLQILSENESVHAGPIIHCKTQIEKVGFQAYNVFKNIKYGIFPMSGLNTIKLYTIYINTYIHS